MTGKILGFDTKENMGTISSDDGKRYKFTKTDWKEEGAPLKETKVDFDIADDGTAKEIYQISDKMAENK